MVREIISVGIGQCGVQLGHALWAQCNAEHKISGDGSFEFSDWTKIGPSKKMDTSFRQFYAEQKSGKFRPRNLFLDSDPTTIDDIRSGASSFLYPSSSLLSGNEDAANNFACGYYSIGKQMMEAFTEAMRKQADECDNLQGFIVTHSVGGGTGSGLGSLILETLATDYGKKCKLGVEVFPSPSISGCVVEPYNALLATSWLLEHIEMSVVLDNEAIYQLCQRKLDIRRPSLKNLNRLITKPISCMTSSMRFENDMTRNADLNLWTRNMLPFPRLHFLMASFAPLTTPRKMESKHLDVHTIVQECLSPQYFMIKSDDFDEEEDQYMRIWICFQGDPKAKEMNSSIQWAKSNKKVTFVPLDPLGFQCCLNNRSPTVINGDDIAKFPRTVTIIGNNTFMGRFFSDRICRPFDAMYAQKAFVHHYLAEGMGEAEFAEAREKMRSLEQEYADPFREEETNDDED